MQAAQYSQYQPVPAQPGYDGQPMQMKPYNGQPCAPGPPPSYQVAPGPGYPTSQSAYDGGQAMYPIDIESAGLQPYLRAVTKHWLLNHNHLSNKSLLDCGVGPRYPVPIQVAYYCSQAMYPLQSSLPTEYTSPQPAYTLLTLAAPLQSSGPLTKPKPLDRGGFHISALLLSKTLKYLSHSPHRMEDFSVVIVVFLVMSFTVIIIMWLCKCARKLQQTMLSRTSTQYHPQGSQYSPHQATNLQPACGWQPVSAGPNLGQLYAPGPPPTYQEAAGQFLAPFSQVAYDGGQNMYPLQPLVQPALPTDYSCVYDLTVRLL
ncbi:U4/U5/U6 small nuclear ribonucleoprotein prp3 [Labeo rohita]|uniref:U4/U5/U6 small nuclear ribonucleoprotein prp3 n=1 Tax=Labeo rohita TaxID=84645 RepID=A0ABQ8LJ11_LABRO|nr:U4/U5/U6 small nuclear ribonucleoprotein prp3 [Labeo rohita]